MKSPGFTDRGQLHMATARPKVSVSSQRYCDVSVPAGFIYAASLSILALTACASSQPIIQVERINVPTYIPTPATLTAPIKVELQPGVTWGEAVGSLYSGLQSCNADKAAIASLKPPNTP